jgi:hypothetical protein
MSKQPIGISVSLYDGELVVSVTCPHADNVRRCTYRRCYFEPAESVQDCVWYQGGDCRQIEVVKKAVAHLQKMLAEFGPEALP